MPPPFRLFPCVLLYVIRTETIFLAISLAFWQFRGVFSRLPVVRAGGGCRLPDGQGMELVHPPPLAVSAGQLVSPEHWPPGDSPSLPSPLLFSSGQCFPLVVSVPLWCSSASAVLLGSLVLVSALLEVVVYDTVLYCFQPRPELTRAHA